MPLAELYFDPEAVSPRALEEIAFLLPYLVAGGLSVDEADGRLTHEDIEVRVRSKGPHDVTDFVIEVTVWAKHYQAREEVLNGAVADIASSIERMMIALGVSGKAFVYILLSPAGFAEVSV